MTGAVLSINGETRQIWARRAVVLATGGFGGSVEALNGTSGRRWSTWSPTRARGEGMAVARAVGAVWKTTTPSLRSGPGLGDVMARRRPRQLPALALDRAKPGLIAVNSPGRRFVDEAVSYHEFVIGMHRSH